MTDEDRRVAGRSFSDDIEAWLRRDSPKTLGSLADIFAEQGFGVIVLLLMFTPALPAPTGGVSHLFELITMAVAVEMMMGRRSLWLPRRWQGRDLGSTLTTKTVPFLVRRVRTAERFSRPRLAGLFRRQWMARLVGALVFVFAAGAAAAPPFTGLDTVPALGAITVALAFVLQDAVMLGVGVAIGAAGITLTFTLGAAALHLLPHLF